MPLPEPLVELEGRLLGALPVLVGRLPELVPPGFCGPVDAVRPGPPVVAAGALVTTARVVADAVVAADVGAAVEVVAAGVVSADGVTLPTATPADGES